MVLKDKLRNIKAEKGDATNCPQKKKNKQVVGSVVREALALQFELDFFTDCMLGINFDGISMVFV